MFKVKDEYYSFDFITLNISINELLKIYYSCPYVIWGAPKSLQMVTAAIKLKDICSLEEKL